MQNLKTNKQVLGKFFNQFPVKNWKGVLSAVLMTTIIASFIAVLQPLKYRSSMHLLVIQDNLAGVDYYTSSKSTQYLTDILTEVVYSTSFLNQVMDSEFRIDDFFSKREQKRKKEWEKTIKAVTLRDTGIVKINAYHTKRDQAEQIVQAVSYVLKTKHYLYHGNGNHIKVTIIDQPITSNWPVKPNILINLGLAVALGLFIGIWLDYLANRPNPLTRELESDNNNLN